jgi:Tol biopolymer transport system component
MRLLRDIWAVGALAAVLAGPASQVSAAVPAGPRLAFMEWSRGAFETKLRTAGPMGFRRQSIAGRSGTAAAVPDRSSAPTWSPDGSAVVFSGAVEGRSRKLFIATADGRHVRPIPGTKGAFRPVFSPDGSTVAFARLRSRLHFDLDGPPFITSFESVTTWTVRIDGWNLRRLTPWRNGLEVTPSSFSPDGTILAASRHDESNPGTYDEAIGIPLAGGEPIVFARGAYEPSFSPDGSRLALIGYVARDRAAAGKSAFFRGMLYVMRPDGWEAVSLARTTYSHQAPPTWDPSGQRIAYVRAGSVMAVNVDGTCRQKVLSGERRVRFGGPAWQPGAGREAGRIAC